MHLTALIMFLFTALSSPYGERLTLVHDTVALAVYPMTRRALQGLSGQRIGLDA